MDINKDIPVPPVSRSGRKRMYPFHEMQVNDSISFDETQAFERARRAATVYARRHEVIFTSRKGVRIVDGEPVKNGEGGTIWRVE